MHEIKLELLEIGLKLETELLGKPPPLPADILRKKREFILWLNNPATQKEFWKKHIDTT